MKTITYILHSILCNYKEWMFKIRKTWVNLNAVVYVLEHAGKQIVDFVFLCVSLLLHNVDKDILLFIEASP